MNARVLETVELLIQSMLLRLCPGHGTEVQLCTYATLSEVSREFAHPVYFSFKDIMVYDSVYGGILCVCYKHFLV